MPWLRRCVLVLSAAAWSCAALAQAPLKPVDQLRASYAAMEQPLAQNQFHRPLVLNSAESSNRLQGDVYAVVDYPFATVSAGLNNPNHWCDVMLLHVNTKYCHATVSPTGATLSVNIGKKTPQELVDVARVDFKYSVAVTTPEYFEILLNAQDGPLGTSDYRIRLEAVALPNSQSFLHLTYSYAMNFAGRLAMQTYLATLGYGKVGFSVIGTRPDGQSEFIGGVRGVVERNTMRYYLAIDTYLGASRFPPTAQFEQGIQAWFAAVEHYPRQLHEVDRMAYLEMKRAEYVRQQSVR
jgi:hypothetical protein